MKIKLILVVAIVFGQQLFAQNTPSEQLNIEQKIARSWVKYRIDMKDGSLALDDNIVKKSASMLIFKKGKGGVLIFGSKAFPVQYTVRDSTLLISDIINYKIQKLTDYELVFCEINTNNKPDNELIRYHYIATTESSGEYFYRQFVKPFVRTLANGDTAYAFNENVYPKFKYEANGFLIPLEDFNEIYETSYDFIERHFVFPPKKKGNFSVSFSVGKKGELKDVIVKESSDSSYNDALIQAVYQTKKRWQPAEYANEKVETLFNYVFKYDDSEEEKNTFDNAVFISKKDKANLLFEKKEYLKAIKFYTECILMQDEDLEPLFKRADSYFALKINKNACLDWSYLAKKGQKKAEQLFMDNCMK